MTHIIFSQRYPRLKLTNDHLYQLKHIQTLNNHRGVNPYFLLCLVLYTIPNVAEMTRMFHHLFQLPHPRETQPNRRATISMVHTYMI